MKLEKNNSRRRFIKQSTFAAAGLTIIPQIMLGEGFNKLPSLKDQDQSLSNKGSVTTVAFICNVYYNQSHADMLGTKIFLGYPMDEGLIKSRLKIVSVWIDQIGSNDIGVRIAKMNDATIYPTIAGALTLGGDKLAVDAVIYIGEHGDYNLNRLGQKMYPRLNYLEQIFRVFDASKKSVPLYSDKHLAYSWLDSKWIYDRALELNVPMMAGSSLPYAWRDPILEHPMGSEITEAVALGYGRIDSYGFHATEILQCMVERRAGGETGVSSVHGIKGNAVWDAIDDGRISAKLVDDAFKSIKQKKTGNLRDLVKEPFAVMVKYNDGTKGAVLLFNGHTHPRADKLPSKAGWAYAAQANGKVVAAEFILDASLSHSHFSYLMYNFENYVMTGKSAAPLERNLLTSGIIDMGVRSIVEGKPKETPFLNIKYNVNGLFPIRPKNIGPTGQSLGPWPPKGYEFINWTK
jgi:hypothetical protein